MKLVVPKSAKVSMSPVDKFTELEPIDVADAVSGRLLGKTGGIYGQPPSEGDDVWCLVADGILRWAERRSGTDLMRLRAVNHGALMAYGASLLLNQPSVPMHIRNLCMAVTPEFQFSAEVKLIVAAVEKWQPRKELTKIMEAFLGKAEAI